MPASQVMSAHVADDLCPPFADMVSVLDVLLAGKGGQTMAMGVALRISRCLSTHMSENEGR